MAAPNLIGITTAVGRTNADWCTTSLTTILENILASGTAIRINSLFVTNVDLNNAKINLEFYRNAIGFFIIKKSLVPSGTSSVLMGKDTGIYLEEGDSLRISASVANALQYVISYEIIS